MKQHSHSKTKKLSNAVKKLLRNGFTIVELLIVIVIIGIIASIVIATYNGVTRRANQTATTSALNDFAKQAQIYAMDSEGTYPTTIPELESLGFKFNTSALATYPTVGANALYCTANGGQDFVLLVYAKNGQKLYVTNTGTGEYTGSENWNQSNYPGRCANILPGSASNAFSGYNITHPDDGWDEWAK